MDLETWLRTLIKSTNSVGNEYDHSVSNPCNSKTKRRAGRKLFNGHVDLSMCVRSSIENGLNSTDGGNVEANRILLILADIELHKAMLGRWAQVQVYFDESPFSSVAWERFKERWDREILRSHFRLDGSLTSAIRGLTGLPATSMLADKREQAVVLLQNLRREVTSLQLDDLVVDRDSACNKFESLHAIELKYSDKIDRIIDWIPIASDSEVVAAKDSATLTVSEQILDGPDSESASNYLDENNVKILRALKNAQVRLTIPKMACDIELDQKTIGLRLKKLRKAGYTSRPNGPKGGEAITKAGRDLLEKIASN